MSEYDNKDDNDETTTLLGHMIDDAVHRLSDESDENRHSKNYKKSSKSNNRESVAENNDYFNNRKNNEDQLSSERLSKHLLEKNDDQMNDNENDEDEDEDDSETRRLLPQQPAIVSRRNGAACFNQQQQKPSKQEKKQQQLVYDNDEDVHQNQHHYRNRHHHRNYHHEPTPPPHHERSNRANKCNAVHIPANIVNENSDNMGLSLNANVDDLSTTMKSKLSKINWYIYLVTTLSAIGGFLFGYDTGIVSGAMVFIRDHFDLSTTMQEVVISVTILFAWIFTFVAGYLSNRFGRKLVIIMASFIFTIGGLMMAFAQDTLLLIAGRATVGLAIGLSSMVIPIYIAEVAPPQIRGKLVSTNVCFITFGQFIASIVAGLFSNDVKNGWRWMLGLASVPAFLQMIFFFFLPESPRWLMQKGRYEKALKSLKKFRFADTSEDDINIEFGKIKTMCEDSERERSDSPSVMGILKNPGILRALFIGSLLMVFQQVAGINTVMYYSATIIQMSGIDDKSTAVWLSALTASINFIFSFVGIILVERVGRRLLTLSSLCGVIVSLFILASGFQLAEFNSPAVSFHGDNSQCSQMTSCGQCVSMKNCGFCFYDFKETHLLNSLMMNQFNGTCLLKLNDNYANATSSYCTKNSKTPMKWVTTWCPSNYSWMTLAGLMLYLFFFSPGMGPMPWTINSEIYPLWARSFCCSVSTSFNWFFNLLISLTFLTLTDWLTIYGAFYLYAGITLFGLVLFFFVLPETKGKTLEEMEMLFQGPLWRISKNSRNLLQDDSVNTSRSTMFTSSTSTIKS